MSAVRMTPKSAAKMERLVTNLEQLGKFRIFTDTEIAAATADLEKAVEHEFSPHTKTGKTIGSLKPASSNGTAAVEMEYGAPYVEFGWHRGSGGYAGDDFAGRALEEVSGPLADVLGAVILRAAVRDI